ncbi:MAG TPA: pyridoxal phosphate-dependent aminotransferase [Clostridiales bacterium]|nr:pyridoxal phosphate-dependent aminotransferase [Clostridiales bacterium]
MICNEKMYALGAKRSVIRELFEYGKARKALVGEQNVYDFSLGNPSVPPPPAVKEALIRLLETQSEIALHGYTSAQGDKGVREIIARHYSEEFGFALDPELMYMTCGAAASLTITLNAIVKDQADEVIAFAPFFPEYRVFTEKAGAKLVVAPPAEGLDIDVEAFRALLNEHTRAVIINSPNNPSGVVYAEQTVKAVASALKEAQKKFGTTIYLISDEPYRALLFDGKKATCFPREYENTVVCYSYSKALSLPGERIGYIAVSPAAVEKQELYLAVCGAGRALGYVCAPALFQRLVGECDGLTSDINVYRENRDILYSALTEMGFTCAYPSGAFYLFVKAPSGDANEFSEAAKALDILVVPSDSFGCEGYVRIAYCVSTDLIKRSLAAFKELAKKYFV